MELTGNIIAFLGILIFGTLSIRCAWCALIFYRAREKAEFAIDYGVWRTDNYGYRLLRNYHASLKLTMDIIWRFKYWRIVYMIEDKWVPLYHHCESVKPMLVSNEQLLYLKTRIEKANKAIELGKTCTLEQNNGYEMRVTVKEFESVVNQGATSSLEGLYCIIDIFNTNGVSGKHQPKQPENRSFQPDRTDS